VDDLKFCPFCGSHCVSLTCYDCPNDRPGLFYRVECKECSATGPASEEYSAGTPIAVAETLQQAARKSWNRRIE